MKVILPIDYSECSAGALAEVARRRWPEGTMVRLLGAAARVPPSAAELWADAAGSLAAVFEERRKRVWALTERAAEELRSAGLLAETRVVDGSLTRAAMRQARTWGAELVVIGWSPCAVLLKWRARIFCPGSTGRKALAVEVILSKRPLR